ncbi:unnamed protein product [Boreogadus saida]
MVTSPGGSALLIHITHTIKAKGHRITLHPGPLGLGLDQSMGSEPLLNSRSLRAWVWTRAWVQTQAQRLSVSRERA